MLNKILMVAVILAGIYLLGRLHARGRRLRTVAPSTPPPPPYGGLVRSLIFGLGLAAILLPVWLTYRSWAEGEQVMRIRVIHPQSGVIQEYQARRKEIRHRTFVALDGSQITLADVERMETTEQLPL